MSHIVKKSVRKTWEEWGFLSYQEYFFGQDGQIQASLVAIHEIAARVLLRRNGFNTDQLELMATPYNAGKLHYIMAMEEIESAAWVRKNVKGDMLDEI